MVQSAYKCGDASGRPGISSEFATDNVTSERRNRLAAIAVFCNGVKGKTAPDLGLSYKSTFVLLHKLCEAMAEKMKSRVVGGEGKEAEVDGGYFGGYVKRANRRKIGSIAVSLKTSMASARSLSFANVVAHRSRGTLTWLPTVCDFQSYNFEKCLTSCRHICNELLTPLGIADSLSHPISTFSSFD
jgi:hypothetical protein